MLPLAGDSPHFFRGMLRPLAHFEDLAGAQSTCNGQGFSLEEPQLGERLLDVLRHELGQRVLLPEIHIACCEGVRFAELSSLMVSFLSRFLVVGTARPSTTIPNPPP
jgi:hypothetical protein